MIQWNPEKDRHIMGTCMYGKVWIRLGPYNNPTSIYTNFGQTRKMIPNEDATIEEAKFIAEVAEESEFFKRKLEEMNQY